MQCPNCGVGIEAEERYATFVVCSYCQSSVVLDAEAAKIAGKMAVLAKPRGPLFVGAAGDVEGKGFNVLGRVRYGYGQGFWDEWYLGLEDGGTAWISEDEDDFVLENLSSDDLSAPDLDGVTPGDWLDLAGTSWHVDEKGVAICEGGEGQLPFAVRSDEEIPFLDLRNDRSSGTLEIDEDGPRLFVGRALEPGAIRVATGGGEARDTLQSEREEGEGRRRRVVRKEGRSLAVACEGCGANLGVPAPGTESLDCAYCGNSISLTAEREECPHCGVGVACHGGEEVQSAVCPGCRAQIVRSDEGFQVLQMLAGADPPKVPFRLGMKGALEGTEYRVVGHIRLRERDEGRYYYTNEFLLRSEEEGYRWLTMESGHFSLGGPISDRPRIDARSAARRTSFGYGGRNWKVFESGRMHIDWVDGELTWVARIGDSVSYMDAIAPPHMLSAEWTDEEMEWSRAVYVPPKEIAHAFNLSVQTLPRRVGVGACQPARHGAFTKWSVPVMAITLIVAIILCISAASGDGRQAMSVKLSGQTFAEEYITEPFVIKGADRLCKATFTMFDHNAWVYLDVAMLNDRDEVVHEFSSEVSYYKGFEGGESWSEGSTTDTVVFKLKDPGEYRLLVVGKSGRNLSAGVSGDATMNIGIRIGEGVMLARFFVVLIIFSVVWLMAVILPRVTFEAKRWGSDD